MKKNKKNENEIEGELELKVSILEEQNLMLSQSIEQLMLYKIGIESISYDHELINLYDAFFTKLSDLLRIPFLVYGEIINDSINVLFCKTQPSLSILTHENYSFDENLRENIHNKEFYFFSDSGKNWPFEFPPLKELSKLKSFNSYTFPVPSSKDKFLIIGFDNLLPEIDYEEYVRVIKRVVEVIEINKSHYIIVREMKKLIEELAKKVNDHKKDESELNRKINEVEVFEKLSVERELRMIELKAEVNNLLKELGKPEKYEVVKG